MTDWTPDTLKEYFDARLDAQDNAVRNALASVQAASAKEERSVEKWRDSANEWRGAMTDRERDFLSRKEFYSMIGSAVAVIVIVLQVAS